MRFIWYCFRQGAESSRWPEPWDPNISEIHGKRFSCLHDCSEESLNIRSWPVGLRSLEHSVPKFRESTALQHVKLQEQCSAPVSCGRFDPGKPNGAARVQKIGFSTQCSISLVLLAQLCTSGSAEAPIRRKGGYGFAGCDHVL